MPNLRNGSKGIRTRAHLIASPAFYRCRAPHSKTFIRPFLSYVLALEPH